MRLQDNIDFTTLTWVKGELDETLKQARHALEAYVEDPADVSQMRFCATYLHQVQGTLRMVELYGAAMATEEMEQLATALLGDQVRDRDDAYAVLMRGIVQLPDYLERLQGGHKDIPIVLLPLVNELRVARGEQALVESALFTPDLSRPLPPTARGPARPLAEAELRRQAEPLRVQFQMALLQWFRNNDPDAQLGKLTHVCDTLISITHEEEARRLFWVAAGVIEALRARAFEPSAPLKQAIGKVEREIKRLCDAGEIGFRVDPPRELTRALLYYVAHAPADHGRLGELRHIFDLDALVPTNEELEHARGSMTGHNRALLSTVGAAIKEDLLRVKDALDLHMRSRTADATSLGAQIEILDRVGDTLGMLGLGVPRRVVNEQRQLLQQVVAGGRAADEATLLDVAGALLYVEASLDDQVQHLGSSGRGGEESDTRALPQAESRKVLDALVQEAQSNFAQAKQCFVAFIESNWDHAQLADVPRLLEEVAGALRILELDEPPRYLESVRRFTAVELLERKRVPNGPQMDTLADVLASLEYYLEALREQRSGRERILETTRISLERLGYWPIPEYRAAAVVSTPAVAAALEPTYTEEVATEGLSTAPTTPPVVDEVAIGEGLDSSQAQAALQSTSIGPSSPEQSTSVAVSAVSAEVPSPALNENQLGYFMPGFEDTGEDIDEEIREVFVEEVQEEISNLGDLLPDWHKDPTSVETLKPIRRVFHTLKGSGRLVGALTLGEFSWKVESMLNRVLDRTIEPGPEVVGLVSAAYRVLPELLTSLRGEQTRQVDLEGIKNIADRLATGELVAYVPPAITTAAASNVGVVPADIEVAPEAPIEIGGVDETAEMVVSTEFKVPAAEAAAEVEPASEIESLGTPFVIDSVLFEILTTEVAGHLETLDAYIAACGRGSTEVNELVLRAVHTMSGAFAMTEVPHIGEVVGPLESYIKRLLARGESPSREGEEVIAEAANAVRQLLRGLNADHPSAPAFPALAERVAGLRDTLPEPLGPLLPLHADTADERAEAAHAERVENERIEADRVAAMRVEAERVQAERVEAERVEAGRVEAERVEAERFEAERVEAERVEAERVEAERLEAERVEAERVEADRLEADRLEAERVEAERVEAERVEAERVEAERVEAERVEAERVEAERVEAERVEAERVEAERVEAERLEAERVEAERVEAERVEAERVEAERVEAERVEAERVEAERVEAERVEAERVEAERVEAERVEAERVEAERVEAERVEAEHVEAERVEAERVEAERVEAERVEAERIEAERVEAERVEAERLEADSVLEFEELEFGFEEPSKFAQPVSTGAFEMFDAEELGLVVEAAGGDRIPADDELALLALPDAVADVGPEMIEAEKIEFAAPAEASVFEQLVDSDDDSGDARPVEADQIEANRIEVERLELEHLEDERLEAERVEAERVEAERVEAERVEAERVEAERVEAERVEAERVEAERVEAERVEAERVEAERVEAERVEAERVEAERVEAERVEAERVEAERVEAERVEAERVEAERVEAERVEAERVEAERVEAERVEAERVEAERVEAERVEAERVEAERVEAERVEAERVEAERVEAERVEAERVEAERVEAERVEAERVEAERVEAERVEAERVEAERVEAERVEAERVEAERVEAERVEADRVEAERIELDLLEAEIRESERAEAALIAQAREEEALMEAELLAMELAESAPAAVAAPVVAPATFKPVVEDTDADPDLPLDIVDLDEELLDIFLEESTDILDHSDGLLARVRAEPEEREHVVGLQRDLHTLKGGARMAGIMPIGDLGHVMESLLEAVAEGRREFGSDGMEVLEQAFDRLHRMVIRVGERRALAMPNRLIQRLEALVRGEVFVSKAPVEAAQPASIGVELEAQRPVTPAAAAVAPAQPSPSLLSIETAIDEEDSGVRAPQEQIRIRADLLDRLVNYAGEVAIYRARLEQQVGAFRGGLFEMDQTTSRLREQLRRLDIETEAQIIARYQREGDDNDREFDPLELDRFSNLQQLSRALAESAADLTSLQSTLEELTRQYDTLLLQQSRVSSDLQEGLMRTRMVPFESLVPRLRRIIRQTSGELGKRVQLRVEGAQGEMDRSVLDRMTAPLEHMLRNALAHGLETADERRAVGKPEEGLVRMVIGREGSEVVIRVSDDGRGINRDAIRRKALERGLMEPSAQLSDRDLYGFILQAGFSTAETVSKIAGRGVGLDVVSSEIRQLGGSLHIESEYGKGTEFVVRLPFTLAVTQAVFVKLGETQFAVPMASVQGVARIAPADLEAQLATGNPTFEYAGERYAIYDLGRLLGHAHVRAAETMQVPLLLARSGDQRAAISIDAVIGGREIVVKPTGPQINSIPGIFGATVMGDGSVVVILDVAPLVRRAAAMQLSGEAPPPVAEMPAARKVPLVMVVDDSITMRKVTGRVLERSGYEVGAAKDGLDAIEKMQERVPDVMLLDIEMPRMDGYELATHMRNDSRLRGVPIIMITSRTGEKHRQRAFEIGVDRYLGKPYQEAELLRNVEEILRVGRG